MIQFKKNENFNTLVEQKNKLQNEVINRKKIHKELVELMRQLQMERLAANKKKKIRKYQPRYRVDENEQIADNQKKLKKTSKKEKLKCGSSQTN